MFETLFGTEMPLAARTFNAFILILLLILLCAMLIGFLRSLKRGMFTKYVALRLISYLLRTIGLVMIAFSIIGVVTALTVLNADNAARNAYAGLFLLFGSISVLMWGVNALAFGELIQVLVDIALNTAPLSEINQNIARLEKMQEQASSASAVADAIR